MWFVCVDRGVTYVVCAECGVVYLECSVYQMWVVLHWKLVVWIEYDLFVLIAVLLVLFAMTVMLINLNAMLFVMRVVLWYMSRWVCDKCHVECVVNVCFVSWLRAVKFTHKHIHAHTNTRAHTQIRTMLKIWKWCGESLNPPHFCTSLEMHHCVFAKKSIYLFHSNAVLTASAQPSHLRMHSLYVCPILSSKSLIVCSPPSSPSLAPLPTPPP